MQFVVTTLCDAATVREGLVNILGAGVTTVYRPLYPAPLQLTAVCMIEVGPGELSSPRKISVEVRSADDAQRGPQARLEGGWDSVDEPDDGRLPVQINFVFDLGAVVLPEPGYYEVRIDVEGLEPRVLPFLADHVDTA